MINRQAATKDFSAEMGRFYRRLDSISMQIIHSINDNYPSLKMSASTPLFSIEKIFCPTALYKIHFQCELMRTQLSDVLKRNGVQYSEGMWGIDIGEDEYNAKPLTNEQFAEVLHAITAELKPQPVEIEPAKVRRFLG